MLLPDAVTVEKDWKAGGYSCGLWVDPPGQRWVDYVHETDELLMVLEGEMEIVIQGQVHRPTPGQELFIPAHGLHSVFNVGLTTSRWLYGYKHS